MNSSRIDSFKVSPEILNTVYEPNWSTAKKVVCVVAGTLLLGAIGGCVGMFFLGGMTSCIPFAMYGLGVGGVGSMMVLKKDEGLHKAIDVLGKTLKSAPSFVPKSPVKEEPHEELLNGDLFQTIDLNKEKIRSSSSEQPRILRLV